jgi:hypothetical protein
MCKELPKPMHPILAKHEADIQLYEALLGPTLGDLIFAMSILSDVQHMISANPRVPEVEQINEAKALIMRAFNFIIKSWSQ